MKSSELLAQFEQQQQNTVQQIEQLQVQFHQLTGAIAGMKQLIENETNTTDENETESQPE